MDPEALLNVILPQALGGTVRWRRLAGNSLLLYVDCEPGERVGLTFWIDPTWHVRAAGRVLSGSREAQFEEDDPDEQAGLEQLGRRLDVLVGTTVEGVDVEPGTFDLTLRLAGGFLVRTFAADANDDQTWRIRVNLTGLALQGSPRGLAVLAPKTRPAPPASPAAG
jgi:hypothetical protein